MIYKETKVKVLDNSGAKVIRCFQLANYSKKKYSVAGDVISGSVIKYKFNRKVKKKQICKVLLITSKKNVLRRNGSCVKFDENRGVAVSDARVLLGTRVFGPISKEVRSKNKNSKLVSLVSFII